MNPVSEASLPLGGLSLGRRVAKNAIWLFIGRVGSQGLAMLFSILVARKLGEVGLGQYAFLTSVIFLGNLTTTFGTDMLIIREMAAKRDFSLLPASLIVQLGISAVFIAAVFLFAFTIPNQTLEAVRALQLYSLALIPLAFYSVFSSALRGFERMDSFTWLNILNGALLVLFALLFVKPATSIFAISVLLLVVQTMLAIAAAGFCFAQIPGFRRALHSSREALARVIKLSAPIAILGLLGAIYQRAPIFLLSTLQGAESTGAFSAALRLVEAAKIGHVALLSALFPAMAQINLSRVDAPAFQKVFSSSLKVLIGFAVVVALGLSFLSAPLVLALYGPSFKASIPVLSTLAWITIPVAISYYLSLQLLAAARERVIMLALGVSSLALVLILVFEIPRAALQTAAGACVFAEVLQAVILTIGWQLYRREKS